MWFDHIYLLFYGQNIYILLLMIFNSVTFYPQWSRVVEQRLCAWDGNCVSFH